MRYNRIIFFTTFAIFFLPIDNRFVIVYLRAGERNRTRPKGQSRNIGTPNAPTERQGASPTGTARTRLRMSGKRMSVRRLRRSLDGKDAGKKASAQSAPERRGPNRPTGPEQFKVEISTALQ